MPNKKKTTKKSVADSVMETIEKRQVKMRPRWYFMTGSFMLGIGFIGVVFLSVGLLLLTIHYFSIFGEVEHFNPNRPSRWQVLLRTFPWEYLVFTVLSTAVGFKLIKKYDSAYKVDWRILAVGLVVSILAVATILNATGVPRRVIDRTPMHPRMEERMFEQSRRFLLDDEQAFERKLPPRPYYGQPHATEN